MRLLLDTHLLLWAAGQPDRLSRSAVALLNNPENELLFSAASIWEIAIKCGLDRQDFRVNTKLLRRGLMGNGYTELAVTGEHALTLNALPPIHKDLFDRILIAQALAENIILLTADSRIAQYSGPIRVV